MKICFKCKQTKEIEFFHKHSEMADGHVNKCKECNNRDVRENRAKKSDYYRDYDKQRQQDPERRKNKRAYEKLHNKNFPEKYRARYLTTNAVRDGRLKRQPCRVCGIEKSEAHHEDYSKPLDVLWMCEPHHKEHHRKAF